MNGIKISDNLFFGIFLACWGVVELFLFSFIFENGGRFRGISACLISDLDFGTQLTKAGVVFCGAWA